MCVLMHRSMLAWIPDEGSGKLRGISLVLSLSLIAYIHFSIDTKHLIESQKCCWFSASHENPRRSGRAIAEDESCEVFQFYTECRSHDPT